MPLSFQSLDHGQVAFGFFNIESDMLLLEQYFFFATDFCRYLITASDTEKEDSIAQRWSVYCIADRTNIGDLMGAIHGVRHTGFIGEVYRRFPFPESPEQFKQKPEGVNTQIEMDNIISKYGAKIAIPFKIDMSCDVVSIGEYRFDQGGFQRLIQYVWQGGYPRWKNDTPPGYVLDMRRCLAGSTHLLFRDTVF